MITRAKFISLQIKARLTAAASDNFRRELDYHYQSYKFAPMTKQRKLESLRKAADKAWDKFFVFFTDGSPRSWSQIVPCNWIRDSLTFDDAVTAGALSVVPPQALGASRSQLEAFARPTEPVKA